MHYTGKCVIVMNKIKENSIEQNLKKKKQEYQALALEDSIQSLKQLDEIVKLHQSTVWQTPYKWDLKNEVLEWNRLIEYTDILPDYHKVSYDLSVTKRNAETYFSTRHFDKEYTFSKADFSKLLYDSFGRSANFPSKKYPSAGGLYPVIPVVYILSETAVEGIEIKGIYVYDSTDMRLLMIKDLSIDKEWNSVIQNINNVSPGQLLSNLALGYALDLKRATIKYHRRGYRHGLIEVGVMAQNFRESLLKLNKSLGDVSWSGFNDNALSHASGLNVRLSPIIMIQWYGKKL